MTTKQTAVLTWAALVTLGLALGHLIFSPSPQEAMEIVRKYDNELAQSIEAIDAKKEIVQKERDELGFHTR